jgi:bla regulator protein blaR1
MQTLLEIGLSNAVVATLLALFAAGVSRLYRRPAVAHVLWLLVLVKLVTPPLMTVPLPWPAAVPRASTPSPERASPLSPSSSLELSGAEAALAADIVALLAPPLSDRTAGAIPTVQTERSAGTQPAETPAAGLWDGARIARLVGCAWLGGAVLCLLVAIVRIHAFQRLLRFARPAPATLQDQAEFLASRLGLARCPRVWLAPGRVSPLLWAVGGRARLVLPAALLERLAPEQRATLLAHELAHACRHDHWVRWLELAVACLYWWHPVAWWARRRVQQAEEECCDAWVVWALPSAAKDYAKALLQTVEFLDSRPALPPAASGVGHLYLLKRRLTMIVREPLSPRLPLPAFLGAVVFGLFVLPVSPQPAAAQSTDEPAVATTTADEPAIAAVAQEPAKSDPASRTRQREMERRLDRLERTLEKLLDEVKAARGVPGDEKASRLERIEKRIMDKEIKPEKKATGVRVIRKEDEETDKPEKGAQEKEKRRFRVLDLQDLDPERREEFKHRIDEAVKKSIDPEKMKEMQRKIEAAVKDINPEKLEAMKKDIEKAAAIKAEKLEAMKKDIEKSISKSLDPEKMKLMHKKIEEAVQQIHPERFEDLHRKIEEAVSRARKEGAEARESPRARDTRDLERRMDRLEQRMDKILEELERSRRSRDKE